MAGTFKKLTYTIAAALVAVLCFLILCESGGAGYASAASVYSFVLDDLKKDEAFNPEQFPAIAGDYSLQVMQIAESTDGNLFVYVYQPSGQAFRLRASKINIAREKNDDKTLSFKPYDLSLINASGVFFKYKVLNFEISTAPVRYYNISNILRNFDSDIDDPPAEGQNISAVPNHVAQLWTVKTSAESGAVSYSMQQIEVIEITQKVVGYCAYDDGYDLGWGAMEGITKAYFVAFDTDRPIDKLISADLTFFATRSPCKICLNNKHTDHGLFYDFHDPEYIDFGTGVYNNEPLTITEKQYYHNQGGGNVRPAKQFLRKRIRTTEEFITDESNKDYELVSGEKLSGTKWVLNFYEAQDKYKVDNVWLSFIPGVNLIHGVADGDCELNNVYDVSILRLEFETDGEHYNLGVVDNVQTGDNNNPFNKHKGGCNCDLSWLPWWAWILLTVFSPLVVLLIFKGIKRLVLLPSKKIKKHRTRRKRERQRADRKRQRRERVKNIKSKIANRFKRKPSSAPPPADASTSSSQRKIRKFQGKKK